MSWQLQLNFFWLLHFYKLHFHAALHAGLFMQRHMLSARL